MLREQVIQEWNNCKTKIQTNWKEGKVLSFRPFVEPVEASEELKDYARQIKKHQAWEKEFQRERTEFTKLESKLEKVRMLVADGEIEKLKIMVRRGEI